MQRPYNHMISLTSKNILLASFFLAVLVCIIYAQTGWHDFICLDDGSYIYNNHAIKNGLSVDSLAWSFSTFYQYNWHPLTWISHTIDISVFGLSPAGHHIHNVLLHAANSIIIFIFLSRTTCKNGKSFVVAAIFAVHPLRAESVAWVAERKDLLSAFFGFSAIYYYGIYSKNRQDIAYFSSLLLYTASLMSKPTFVTLPLLLLLLDIWPLEYQQLDKGKNILSLKDKIPFFALAIASSIVTIIAQHKGGAVVKLESLSIPLRLGNALISYYKYILNSIIPHNLSIFYLRQYPIPVHTAVISGILLIAITAILHTSRKKEPALSTGWSWYLLTLVPMIGIVQVGDQAMADRYSYIPGIGLNIIFVWGITKLCDKFSIIPAIRGAAAICLVLLYGGWGWQQTSKWRNSYTLFQHTLQAQPNNHVVLALMGDQFREHNHCKEAVPYYQQAIQLYPNQETTHNNIAICLTKTGDYTRAKEHLALSLMLNPGSTDTLFNMAILLAKSGEHEVAISSYKKILSLSPDDAETHFYLGESLRHVGKHDEALYHYETAYRLNPDFQKPF